MKKDSKFVGMTGGSGETEWSITGQEPEEFADFPAYDDNGNILRYSQCSNYKDFFSRKRKRVRPAIRLTVTGNAVSCEYHLRDLGEEAHAVEKDTVFVVIEGAPFDVCRRCDYSWRRRGKGPAKQCPNCGSALWQTPRTGDERGPKPVAEQ